MKLKFPRIYNVVVELINKTITAVSPHSVYITDSLGGSFKQYFVHNNMPLKIDELEKNMDSESAFVIQTIIQRLLLYPDQKFKGRTPKRSGPIGGTLPIETEAQRKFVAQQIQEHTNSVRLSKGGLEESVFYFYHGLSLMPEQVHEYIRDQHFMDIGAYIGDSAIALRKYQYSKIYSLEISLKSIEKYRLNMRENKIPAEKFEVMNVGVSASDEETLIRLNDTGSAGFNLYRNGGKYDEIQVQMKSVDWLVEQNKIQPKFIKVDIEGAAMDFVKGAKNTLIKFRPVLSIAVYHNPVEFFEVKPVLESMLVNYVFLARKTRPPVSRIT